MAELIATPAWVDKALKDVLQAINSSNLHKRHRLVLDWLLRRTLAHPTDVRGKAYVPNIELIGGDIGISKGNTHFALKQLREFRVVWERPKDFYGVLVSTLFWRGLAKQRVFDTQYMEQPDLIAPPPEFNDEVFEIFEITAGQNLPTAAGVTPGVRLIRSTPAEDASLAQQTSDTHRESAGSGTGGGPGVRPAEATPPPALIAMGKVPDSGTAHTQSTPHTQPAGENAPQQSSQNAGPVRSLPTVPESGTGAPSLEPLAKAQACTKVPKSTNGPVTSLHERSVPESGTGKLDPMRQELMDRLEQAGAFGPNDGSKFNWLKFVRQRPAVTERLLGELKYRLTPAQMAKHGPVRNVGGWLNYQWHEWSCPDR